jgi:hypothetical protein
VVIATDAVPDLSQERGMIPVEGVRCSSPPPLDLLSSALLELPSFAPCLSRSMLTGLGYRDTGEGE